MKIHYFKIGVSVAVGCVDLRAAGIMGITRFSNIIRDKTGGEISHPSVASDKGEYSPPTLAVILYVIVSPLSKYLRLSFGA